MKTKTKNEKKMTGGIRQNKQVSLLLLSFSAPHNEMELLKVPTSLILFSAPHLSPRADFLEPRR